MEIFPNGSLQSKLDPSTLALCCLLPALLAAWNLLTFNLILGNLLVLFIRVEDFEMFCCSKVRVRRGGEGKRRAQV